MFLFALFIFRYKSSKVLLNNKIILSKLNYFFIILQSANTTKPYSPAGLLNNDICIPFIHNFFITFAV